MRIFRVLFVPLCLSLVVVGLLSSVCAAANLPDNVAAEVHFLGTAETVRNTNAAPLQKLFALKTTVDFENLVLNRLANVMAKSFHFQSNPSFRPLLDGFLRAESVASIGGIVGQPLQFVVAVHLDKAAAQTWQQTLGSVNAGQSTAMQAGAMAGRQWNKGAVDSFWMAPAGDWLLLGRGETLAPVRAEYLGQIQKSGRPVPALTANCLEADIDWPKLANWVPLSSVPLKLGRTTLHVNADRGSMHLACDVTYPAPFQWQPQPLNLPTKLVRQPLISFAMGRDVEPFLKPGDILDALGTNPFRDQFYFWAMGELALQSYVAWPVNDPSNKLVSLSAQALDIFNPKLKTLNGSELVWKPSPAALIWSKLQLTTPTVLPAPKENGNFLVAGLFPLTPGTGPAPQQLFSQFQGRENLVYYEWELTGPRLKHLITVSQMVPILQMLRVGPEKITADNAAVTATRLPIEEQWLLGLTGYLGNTATEITKTGPDKLSISRSGPIVFSSLELLILSHILSDTPAGPLDWNLLPQAKMTGTGAPPRRH